MRKVGVMATARVTASTATPLLMRAESQSVKADIANTLSSPAARVRMSTPFIVMFPSTSASSASCAEVLSSPKTASVRATNTPAQTT